MFFYKVFIFAGPEVTQAIKLTGNPLEVNEMFLEPLNFRDRTIIFFAINNNSKDRAGGSHWSLCVYSKTENLFYHFDSLFSSNLSSCKELVRILKICLNCPSAQIESVVCTQQNNSFDCGVFVLCHTDLVCQTFDKSGTLNSIEKLRLSNVMIKRNEIKQIIKRLSGKI